MTLLFRAEDRASALVEEIRGRMVNRSANLPRDVNRLLSLFLIGSCSDEVPPREWYQDYDVHLVFDGLDVSKETLDWFRETLNGLLDLGDSVCRVEALVRDRHWKMVPDSTYEVNIGIHATFMNAADHFRRANFHPVLALNMYSRCLVLHGRHPSRLCGFRGATAADYCHSVGGIGWLAENLARAASLHVLLPEDRDFYPFVAGYCWNVASSLMFHLVTLLEGRVTGRSQALEFFVKHASADRRVCRAATQLYDLRECPDHALPSPSGQFNAAARVLAYVNRIFEQHSEFGGQGAELSESIPALRPRSLYPEVLSGVSGEGVEDLQIIDVVREPDYGDYYGSIEAALASVRDEVGPGLSTKEAFEFVRDWLADRSRPTCVRVWDNVSLPRRVFSVDYALAREEPSLEAVLFGWEDGVQALLQRLHEMYMEVGEEDDRLTQLSAFSAALTEARTRNWGGPKAVGGSDVFGTAESMAAVLRPHIPVIGK